MAVFNVFEVDGGESGYNYLEVYDRNMNKIGWLVVAGSDAPYSDPAYRAHHEYWYFNEDITRESSFIIKLVSASLTWPPTWPYRTTATTQWEDSNIQPRTYVSSAPTSGVTYYQPTASSPTSNVNFLGWQWPGSSDGKEQWYARTADYCLSGTVGTQWTFNRVTPSTVYGYFVDQTIPR